MTLKANTSLKRGAIVAAILWTCWMIWWSGSLAPADIIILSICGAAFGYVWYVAMRFVLTHMRRLPRDSDDGVEGTQPSRLYAWTVWAGLMALTGIATACLLDLVSPLIPFRRLALADLIAVCRRGLARADVVAAAVDEAPSACLRRRTLRLRAVAGPALTLLCGAGCSLGYAAGPQG